MMQNSTQTNLVAYLYGDATPARAEETEAALAADPLLAEELDELSMAKSNVPRVLFSAPPAVLGRIIGYSAEQQPCVLC